MAIYNEQEGEVEVGPCMLGATTLMAPAHRAFACLPCGYRTLNSCMIWEVPLQELLPVRLAPVCALLCTAIDSLDVRDSHYHMTHSPVLASLCPPTLFKEW